VHILQQATQRLCGYAQAWAATACQPSNPATCPPHDTHSHTAGASHGSSQLLMYTWYSSETAQTASKQTSWLSLTGPMPLGAPTDSRRRCTWDTVRTSVHQQTALLSTATSFLPMAKAVCCHMPPMHQPPATLQATQPSCQPWLRMHAADPGAHN